MGQGQHGEERQRGQDRQAEQQAQIGAGALPLRGAGVPRRAVVEQHAAVRQHQQGDEHAGRAADHQRPLPAEQLGQEHHGDGRRREADIAAEGVDREGAAHALDVHRGGQDGVVGGMEHGVAETGQHHQHEQGGIGREHADQRDREREQDEAADQDVARAEAVDQEPDRRLGQRRGAVEHGERQAECRVADPVLAAQQGEQRRQDQDVEVAEEVAGGDQADDLAVPRPRRHLAAEVGHGRSVPDFGSARYGDLGRRDGSVAGAARSAGCRLLSSWAAAAARPRPGRPAGRGPARSRCRPASRSDAAGLRVVGRAGVDVRHHGREHGRTAAGREQIAGERVAVVHRAGLGPDPQRLVGRRRSGRRACPTSRRRAAAPAGPRCASRSGRSRRAAAASAAPAQSSPEWLPSVAVLQSTSGMRRARWPHQQRPAASRPVERLVGQARRRGEADHLRHHVVAVDQHVAQQVAQRRALVDRQEPAPRPAPRRAAADRA